LPSPLTALNVEVASEARPSTLREDAVSGFGLLLLATVVVEGGMDVAGGTIRGGTLRGGTLLGVSSSIS